MSNSDKDKPNPEDRFKHFAALSRMDLQRELRGKLFSGNNLRVFLWEFAPIHSFIRPIIAGKNAAIAFGIKEGDIIAYEVYGKEGGFTSLIDFEPRTGSENIPPYPDPFDPHQKTFPKTQNKPTRHLVDGRGCRTTE